MPKLMDRGSEIELNICADFAGSTGTVPKDGKVQNKLVGKKVKDIKETRNAGANAGHITFQQKLAQKDITQSRQLSRLAKQTRLDDIFLDGEISGTQIKVQIHRS